MRQLITIDIQVETGTRQTVAVLVERIEKHIRNEVGVIATLSFPPVKCPIDVLIRDWS